MSPIEAFVEALLPDWPRLEAAPRAAACVAATRRVTTHLACAPRHVRLAAGALSLAFFILPWLAGGGRGFAHLALERRRALIKGWQRVGRPAALMVRLYRSMALLAYLELPEVRAALGADQAEERMRRHRERRAALPAKDA
jgi:hypothetical protein